MSHRDRGAALASPLGDCSVSAHRRDAAAAAVGAGVAALVGLWAVLGPSIAAGPAALGTAGAVYAVGIELACRRFGHAVDCATESFCECRRCGRPMEE
jgi:hypothetical protein